MKTQSAGQISGNGISVRPPPTDYRAQSWEQLTKDQYILLQGHGHSSATAFTQLAIALMTLITQPDRIEPRLFVQLNQRAPTLDEHLLRWLTQLISSITTEGLLFNAFDVRIDGHHLHSCQWGEAFDSTRHYLRTEASSLQIHKAQITQLESNDWIAECQVQT